MTPGMGTWRTDGRARRRVVAVLGALATVLTLAPACQPTPPGAFRTPTVVRAPVVRTPAPPTTARAPLPQVPRIDRTSRAAVADAYRNWLRPTMSVRNVWDGSPTPCRAGRESPAHQAATLRAVNFFRALVGVPPVTLDPDLSSRALEAALVMHANNRLSHTPAASWACWTQRAFDGASHSNLYLGVTGPSAIAGYMVDPGSNNLEAGHRRWIMYAPTTSMGTGSTSLANALWVVGPWSPPDPRRAPAPWPTAGWFPVQLEPDGRWSLSMSGANFSRASVTVTGPDGRRLDVVRHVPVDGAGDPTLVWTVRGLDTRAGQPTRTYRVDVSGIERPGAPSTYRYHVNLFDATT